MTVNTYYYSYSIAVVWMGVLHHHQILLLVVVIIGIMIMMIIMILREVTINYIIIINKFASLR